MVVRGSVRHGRELHRHAHDLAVAHAALGDDMLAELLQVLRPALEHRHFEAGVMIEMHVQRSKRQLVVLVIGGGKALGELPTHSRF